MKIYTKQGDRGQTSLIGGKKVAKSHQRIDAYGSIDELNAHLGALRDQMGQVEFAETLLNIQHTLFVIGSQLAADPAEKVRDLPTIDTDEVGKLEDLIDRLETNLPQLRHFIIPGGNIVVSQIHITRSVCRRTERVVVGLSEKEVVDAKIITYLNRLSDFLFVLARWVAQDTGTTEQLWKRKI